MRKKTIAVTGLALFLVTGMSAGRAGNDIKAPVCRFMHFYVAAEQSEMNVVERVLYSLAVAVKPAKKCTSAS